MEHRRSLTTTAGSMSDLRALRQLQCVLDVDTKIANGAFNFRVAEQNLNSTKIARLLVDQSCLCPSKRVRPVIFAAETDAADPLVNQPRILPGA